MIWLIVFLYISYAVEILSSEEVLKLSGELNIAGWANNPIFIYNPKYISQNIGQQKKEWEHYTIVGKEFALSLTLLDIGFTTAALVDFSHFEKNIYYSNFFNGHHEYSLSPTPYGNTYWEKDGEFISFSYKEGKR